MPVGWGERAISHEADELSARMSEVSRGDLARQVVMRECEGEECEGRVRTRV